MNNIFDYAPKELVMDAFLCWCFNFFNSEDVEGKEFSVKLVNFIYGLKHKGKKLNVSDIKVKRQYLKSKIDVYVRITTTEGKVIHFIFENKLYSSPHSNQLLRHIKEVEEDYKKSWKKNEDKIGEGDEKVYIYFKLGYKFNEDRKEKFKNPELSEKHKKVYRDYILKLDEYVELDRATILSFLSSNKIRKDTFEMYFDYIKKIDNSYKELEGLIIKNKALTNKERDKVFWCQEGGYEILTRISEYSNLRKTPGKGTSLGGAPFVNLSIVDGYWEKETDDNEEFWRDIFWIDWRKNSDKNYTPYLCLRQYRIGKLDSKLDNIFKERYREIFEEISKGHKSLTFGNPHNSGKKEREIGILFFEGTNTIPLVISEISKFTKKFVERVKEEKIFYGFE